MEVMPRDQDIAHLLVSYAYPEGIAPEVGRRSNLQASLRGCRANQADHDPKACQRSRSPVFGNVAEDAVLDLVPLAGPRREVADGDRKSSLACKPLKLALPKAYAIAVAAAAVSRNEKLGRRRVPPLPHA